MEDTSDSWNRRRKKRVKNDANVQSFQLSICFFFAFIVKATPFFRDRLIRMYSKHVNDSLAKNNWRTPPPVLDRHTTPCVQAARSRIVDRVSLGSLQSNSQTDQQRHLSLGF